MRRERYSISGELARGLMMPAADGSHGAGLLQALRRVRYGHVTVGGPEIFTDGEESFPRELVPFLHELLAHGQVRLEERQGGELHVEITAAGEELLAELETPDDRPMNGGHRGLDGLARARATSGRVAPSPSQDDRPSGLTEADIVARWPFLASIVELPGPPWQFWLMPSGSLACQRIHDTYAESLWIVDEKFVGLNRTPIHGRSARVVSPVYFAATVGEVRALLQQPVRWEDEP